MADVARFEAGVLESKIFDPYAALGQKINFGKLGPDDPLYGEWVEVSSQYLAANILLPRMTFLIGMPGGTNHIVHDIAARLDDRVIPLESYRNDDRTFRLQPDAEELIKAKLPACAVIFEGVSEGGASAGQVAWEAVNAGAEDVAVVVAWQGSAELTGIYDAGFDYYSIVKHPLDQYANVEYRQTA